MTFGDEILSQFNSLALWKRGGERAPHKPLLILVALGQVQTGQKRLMKFSTLEPLLRDLLRDFGPPRVSHHPEYPFWRLQRDGVWEVACSSLLKSRRGNSDPLLSELRKNDVSGGFPDKIHSVLSQRPELIRELGRRLLEAHFPSSLHGPIAAMIGLDLEDAPRSSQRDGRFRLEVINAWQHQCGFCGFSLKFDQSDLGLEAAHIKWVQAGGAELLDNGICCCVLHHQAFDRGALTVSDGFRVLVSSRLHGSSSDQWFNSFHGKPLLLPRLKSATPKAEFLKWHRREVFRGPPIG